MTFLHLHLLSHLGVTQYAADFGPCTTLPPGDRQWWLHPLRPRSRGPRPQVHPRAGPRGWTLMLKRRGTASAVRSGPAAARKCAGSWRVAHGAPALCRRIFFLLILMNHGEFCRLSVSSQAIFNPSVMLGSARLIPLVKCEALRLILRGCEDFRPLLNRSGSDWLSRRRKQTVSSSQKAWRSQGVGFGKHT